jgi:photosystem II stability/assembly factor-like uncharacterized protein
MKIKIYKILGVALTVAMLVSLIVGFSAVPAAAKTYDTNEWEKWEIPEEGSGGDYILYPSDINAIAITIDGTLYAGVNAAGVFSLPDSGDVMTITDDDGGDYGTLVITAGTATVGGTGDFSDPDWATDAGETITVTATDDDTAGYWMSTIGTAEADITTDADSDASAGDADQEVFKSTDDGASWDKMDDYGGDKVIAIAVSPVDEEIVYFASETTVYRTTDGGDEFNAMSQDPWEDEVITAVDVTYYNDAHIVGISTLKGANARGDVYIFDEGETFGLWVDREATGTTTNDVLDVAFSPYFEEDRQIVAIISDGTDVWVTTAVEGGSWDGDVADSQKIGVPNATKAQLAFPADYDADPDSGDYVQFLSVSDGAGTDTSVGIYMIDGVEVGSGSSVATALETDYDAYSIDVEGDASSANIIYGVETDVAEDAMVRFSTDGGDEFDPAYKEPSGLSNCQILLEGDMAYAGTSGANSAFSVSSDAGDTWSQPGLVDSAINAILSWEHLGPDTFLFTTDGIDESCWKTSDQGDSWYRALSTDVTIVQSSSKKYEFDNLAKTTTGDNILWVHDGGTPTYIWKSDDGGDTWSRLKSPTEVDNTKYPIQAWKIIDESEIIFFSGYTMYRTLNGGTSWSEVYHFTEYSGASNVASLKVDKATGMYLVWNKDQGANNPILISDDEGESWEEANPEEGTFAGAIGNFDADFGVPGAAGYNTIYAANNVGIWRYVIDESSDWEQIDATYTDSISTAAIELFPMPTIPPGSGDPDPDGTLYVYQAPGVENILRTVYPTDRDAGAPDYEVDFESIGVGGPNGFQPGAPIVSPAGLSMFCADQTGPALYMYTDTLNKPGKLTSPADDSTSGREGSAQVDWEEMDDADFYEVQWAEDSEFEVNEESETTEVTNYRIKGLEPGMTYYWRVRVEKGEPAWSPWSEVWSFTTALGAPQWNPFVGGIPESPYNGATNVSLSPSFAWNPADWATGYEFVLATDANYSQAVVSKTGANALTNSVYLCEQALAYETTYYWKVRAVSKSSSSEWANAVFTTMAQAPAPPSAPPPPVTPEQEPLIDPMFLWIIIGIGAVLVIALIVLIVRTRRVA